VDGTLFAIHRKLQSYTACLQGDGHFGVSDACPELPETQEQIGLKIFALIFTILIVMLTFFSVRTDKRRFKSDY